MTREERNAKELQITMALFNATVQQTTALTGVYKHQAKQIFNKWQKLGFKLFDVIENNVDNNGLSKDFDEATRIIEDSVGVLRNKLD